MKFKKYLCKSFIHFYSIQYHNYTFQLVLNDIDSLKFFQIVLWPSALLQCVDYGELDGHYWKVSALTSKA